MKKLYGLLILLVLIAVVAIVLTVHKSKNTAWREQYDLGVRYLAEKKYSDAVIAFSAAIEIEPKRSESYIARGDAYTALDHLDDAYADFATAVSLHADSGSGFVKPENFTGADAIPGLTGNAVPNSPEEYLELAQYSLDNDLPFDLPEISEEEASFIDKIQSFVKQYTDVIDNSLGSLLSQIH